MNINEIERISNLNEGGNNNINNRNSQESFRNTNEFNSNLLLENQENNSIIQRESGNTISIIEKGLFNKDNNSLNIMDSYRKDDRNNNKINNLQNERNPFYVAKNEEENNLQLNNDNNLT